MNVKMRNVYSMAYGLSFSFISCALVLLGFFLTSCGQKITEQELRTQFFEHKTEINSLLKMQVEDSRVVRIAPTFTRLENNWSWPREDVGFSQERWNEYRRIFILADVKDGLQKYENNIFYLVKGERGFAFMGKIPKEIRESYKDCLSYKKKDTTCFVPLEGNWYLFIG